MTEMMVIKKKYRPEKHLEQAGFQKKMPLISVCLDSAPVGAITTRSSFRAEQHEKKHGAAHTSEERLKRLPPIQRSRSPRHQSTVAPRSKNTRIISIFITKRAEDFESIADEVRSAITRP